MIFGSLAGTRHPNVLGYIYSWEQDEPELHAGYEAYGVLVVANTSDLKEVDNESS